MTTDNISSIFLRPGPLAAEITARMGKVGNSPGLTVKRDLERYYYAIQYELRAVQLSEPEAWLIVDALNATPTDPYAAGLLWAEIGDAIKLDKLDTKWKIDGPALVAKLRELTYTQSLAICDAVERWWNLPADNRTTNSLYKVGLLR
jgi:hypothetical protein